MSDAASDFTNRLSELTLEEKASLCIGPHFWYTASVERLGIPRIMVSDGPHGLRAQPGEGDHVRVLGARSPQSAQQGSAKFADLIATAAEPRHRLNKAPSQESAMRLVNGWSIARTAHAQFSALK